MSTRHDVTSLLAIDRFRALFQIVDFTIDESVDQSHCNSFAPIIPLLLFLDFTTTPLIKRASKDINTR